MPREKPRRAKVPTGGRTYKKWKNLPDITLEEYNKRLTAFLSLPLEKKKFSALKGPPTGMCPKGKVLFEEFCDNPIPESEFTQHYDLTRPDGCLDCYMSFISHLWATT